MHRARAVITGLLLTLHPALGCATQPRTPAEGSQTPTLSQAAQAQAELRARVESLLDRSAPAEEWQALGGNALGVLEQILNDPAVQPGRRARAVAAIGLLEGPEPGKRLLAILKDRRREARYRAPAAAALARRGGAEAATALKLALTDPDPKMRGEAALALSGVGGAEVRSALEERLAKEEDATTRETIQQALTRLQP